MCLCVVAWRGVGLEQLTETDLTCRVIALDKPAASTPVTEVMTASPRTVAEDDDCLDALTLMSKHHFRHLPVLAQAGGGAVRGVLDIAKCLHDAIERLEKRERRLAAQSQASSRHWAEGRPLPTVRDVLEEAIPAVTVGPDTTVAEAAKGMKDSKKAALIVAGGKLLGLVTFKDLMARVLGQGLTPRDTTVAQVMTESPDSVGPTVTVSGMMCTQRRISTRRKGAVSGSVASHSTSPRCDQWRLNRVPDSGVLLCPPPPSEQVLQALETMREGHYLNLPVLDPARNNRVLGLISVMDVVHALSRLGDANGDANDGGRAFWASTLEDDGAWETASVSELGGAVGNPPASASVVSVSGSTRHRKAETPLAGSTPKLSVASLRPRDAPVVDPANSVASAAQAMIERKSAAVLVMSHGKLAGILTDTDVTRRVVAAGLEPNHTTVADVMTKDPRTVALDDDCLDALTLMSGNRFRHLPVVGQDGGVTAVLDIARCLRQAIERVSKKEEAMKAMTEQIAALCRRAGLGLQEHQVLALPTARDVLDGAHNKPAARVAPNAPAAEAAKAMQESGKAALVVDPDSGRLVGVSGPALAWLLS
jgi:CBS domain-containing protein